MLVECHYCGAPLDVREGTRLTKCRYCGTVDERTRLKTVAQQTPRDFRPPPRWTPPAHVEAASEVALPYKKGGSGAVVGIVVVAVVGIPAIIIGLKVLNEAGVGAPGGKALAAVSLAHTPKELATTLAGNPTDTSLYTRVDSPRFEYVTLSWDEKHPGHPTSFYLAAKQDQPPDDALKRALESKLFSPLDEHGSWSWENVNLQLDPKTGSISGSVRVTVSGGAENPVWKRQLDALWHVVVSVAFDQKIGPTAAESRDLLGSGYRFADLAKIAPTTRIDSARARVTALFPGAVFSDSSQLEAKVAVDQPMFRHVELKWQNEKDASMYEVGFRPSVGSRSYVTHREAVVRCLTPVLGKPSADVTDYMKQKKDWYFTTKTARVYVAESYLYLIVDSEVAALDPELWKQVVSSLDECRP